jgi:hypothetical protein
VTGEPMIPMTVAKVRVARGDVRLFLRAAGTGDACWLQLYGPGPNWLSWSAICDLGEPHILVDPYDLEPDGDAQDMWAEYLYRAVSA